LGFLLSLRRRGFFLGFFFSPLLNRGVIGWTNFGKMGNRLQKFVTVMYKALLALRAAYFEFMVHKDGVKGTGLFANSAVHADREIDVENFRPFERPALFIRVADDIDALRRAFLGANVTGHAAYIVRRAVVNQERKISETFLLGQSLFGILDGNQARRLQTIRLAGKQIAC